MHGASRGLRQAGKFGAALWFRNERNNIVGLFPNSIARFSRYFTDHQEPHEDHEDCGHLSKQEHLSQFFLKQERFKSQTGMHWVFYHDQSLMP